MSCVFDIVLLWILTLFLHVQEGGGSCSPMKEAECEALWRTCQNGQCDVCLLEIEGECYDPSGQSDSVLEKLENCDPTLNPECKKSLEDVGEQLLEQLETDKKKDSNNGGSTDVYVEKEASISQSDSKLKKNSGKHSEEENKRDAGFRSKEPASKNHPVEKHKDDSDDIPDVYFLIIIIACTLSGVAGIALSGYCWYKLHYSDEKTNKSDYIPGVKKRSLKNTTSKNGDRKLDYKAEMYHYVHTKNQLAAMEKAKSDHLSSGAVSNDDDDDQDDVDDNTVYECPGLAPTGDMTVVNPLFSDQDVSMSDEGRAQSARSSPGSPSRSIHSPSR